METFTDGVFAIAATLLVLEISIDSAHTHDLGSAYGVTLLVAVFSPLASVFLTFAIAAFYLPSAALLER